jgi:hypothetical protein
MTLADGVVVGIVTGRDLEAPVPNSRSTYSSAMTGMRRPRMGTMTSRPRYFR